MGLFNILSGKVNRLNNLFLPVSHEIKEKIEKLNDSIEKFAYSQSFEITLNIIIPLFHPDKGMFKDTINYLERQQVKKIFEILIMQQVIDMTTGKYKMDGIDKARVIKNAIIVLALDDDEINALFSMFENASIEERFTFLWESICRNANKDIRDIKHFQKFVEICRNAFPEN